MHDARPRLRADTLPREGRAYAREHGMALILVVLVLTALVAIGTPFVISMKLQERGSIHTEARQRAHLAATSARNHAVAHLFNQHASRAREFVDASDARRVPRERRPAVAVPEQRRSRGEIVGAGTRQDLGEAFAGVGCLEFESMLSGQTDRLLRGWSRSSVAGA